MRAKTRRKLEMGARVLEFTRLHQSSSPGDIAAATRLQERLARADQLARQQRQGLGEVRTATARKRELRQMMHHAFLDHLVSVAEVASVEQPNLREKFQFPEDATYHAFWTAASSMAVEARSRKDLLVRHGLSDEVLAALEVALEEFATVVEQGTVGRIAHVGASAELVTVAEEVVQVVKVMNGLNRFRFASQPELLAAWESASNVFATPRAEVKPEDPSTPATGGADRPAA